MKSTCLLGHVHIDGYFLLLSTRTFHVIHFPLKHLIVITLRLHLRVLFPPISHPDPSLLQLLLFIENTPYDLATTIVVMAEM